MMCKYGASIDSGFQASRHSSRIFILHKPGSSGLGLSCEIVNNKVVFRMGASSLPDRYATVETRTTDNCELSIICDNVS